ncbi:MAG: hypothetical protein OQK82_05510 [Candidatus Pacearchaeota archaeon]|nr:hypothetical protein [Candidatus Pacearchaeota archaeon]
MKNKKAHGLEREMNYSNFPLPRNRSAAMEMSVGTIVTIVLLMTVLILGLVLVRSIFSSSTSAIDEIDSAVQNEITKLFSEDNSKKVVIYPSTREISLEKGEDGGFGFSIKNIEEETKTFSYVVSVGEVGCSGVSEAEAENFIGLGRTGSGITIPSGSQLEDAILVKFSVPESASLCDIRYNLDVKADSEVYLPTLTVDLMIK